MSGRTHCPPFCRDTIPVDTKRICLPWAAAEIPRPAAYPTAPATPPFSSRFSSFPPWDGFPHPAHSMYLQTWAGTDVMKKQFRCQNRQRLGLYPERRVRSDDPRYKSRDSLVAQELPRLAGQQASLPTARFREYTFPFNP